MNVILKTKSWTYVWLTILLAWPAKTEALVFCCSLVVFFCLLLRAWCVKVRQSAVAGHSQTLEDFDRLSALAWGALAIWSVGSRGPWGHIQVKFVCEGRHNFLHIVFCDTQRCVWWGGERSRDEVKLIKPPLALERRSPASFAFDGSPKTRGSHFESPCFSRCKRFFMGFFFCLELDNIAIY